MRSSENKVCLKRYSVLLVLVQAAVFTLHITQRYVNIVFSTY